MPVATRIIAVRHGETDWNVETRIQGQLDIGLNDKGVWQAQRAGRAGPPREERCAIQSAPPLQIGSTLRRRRASQT